MKQKEKEGNAVNQIDNPPLEQVQAEEEDMQIESTESIIMELSQVL